MLIYKDGIVADYREVFQNTSFPSTGITNEFLHLNNAYKVNEFKTHNEDTQKLVTCAPYIEDGLAYTVQIEELTKEELDQKNKNKENDIRNIRNTLLIESDWSQLNDSPVNKEQWAIYRQELRDITLQSNWPININWPEKP